MNWLHAYWFSYEWPSIKGNGPEDATSLLVVGLLTGIFVPRVRRWWIAREQSVHAKLDGLIAHHEAASAERSVMHSKLDAIIKHHGIPSDLGGTDGSVLGESEQD